MICISNIRVSVMRKHRKFLHRKMYRRTRFQYLWATYVNNWTERDKQILEDMLDTFGRIISIEHS